MIIHTNIEELFGTFHEPCNVNINDSDGNTPLHIACIEGNEQLYTILMSTGRCKSNVKNMKGKTPLHTLHVHVVMHMHTLELAITKTECDFNIQDVNRNSPLHTAISNELDDVLNMLLIAPTIHLDLNLRNNFGDCPCFNSFLFTCVEE